MKQKFGELQRRKFLIYGSAALATSIFLKGCAGPGGEGGEGNDDDKDDDDKDDD